MNVRNIVVIAVLPLLSFFITESFAQEKAVSDGGLKVVSVKDADSYDYSDYGLSGENKPNGIIERFRQSTAQNLPEFLQKKKADIIDYTDDGWLVLEREKAVASLYDTAGEVKWQLNLADYVEEKSMEVQDIRYKDGILYFNAACQSYSKESSGLCSSLYAVYPTAKERLWKSEYLVSNNIFIIDGDRIIAGYGFTAEPDYLFIVDRATGNILNKKKLDTAHSYMEIAGDTLKVITYNKLYIFSLL